MSTIVIVEILTLLSALGAIVYKIFRFLIELKQNVEILKKEVNIIKSNFDCDISEHLINHNAENDQRLELLENKLSHADQDIKNLIDSKIQELQSKFDIKYEQHKSRIFTLDSNIKHLSLLFAQKSNNVVIPDSIENQSFFND